MSKFPNLWSCKGFNISFYGRPFQFTAHKAESGTLSEGDNRLVRYQHALIDLLKKGECGVKDQELQMAIIAPLLKLIKQDEQFSKFDESTRNTLIELALRQLPLKSSLSFSIKEPSEQPPPPPETKKKAPPSPALSTFSDASNGTPKALETIDSQEQAPPAAPREFTLEGDSNDIENIRIYYAGDEIYLDDPDEHLMLASILKSQSNAKGNGIDNKTLAVILGSAKRVPPTYLTLLKSMEADAPGSSKTLSFDRKTQRHSVKAPINDQTSQQAPKAQITLLGRDFE